MHHQAYDVLDPKTGAVLRAATWVEVMAYHHQPARHPALRRNIQVGAVVVHEFRAEADGRYCDCPCNQPWMD